MLPQKLFGKESACISGDAGDTGSIPGSGRSPGPTPVFLPTLTPVFFPGETHGQRSQAGCSPLDCKESHMTEVT